MMSDRSPGTTVKERSQSAGEQPAGTGPAPAEDDPDGGRLRVRVEAGYRAGDASRHRHHGNTTHRMAAATSLYSFLSLWPRTDVVLPAFR